MDYQRYKISRDLAWEILLSEKVCELPVRMRRLCKQMGITLVYGSTDVGSDGYSTIINGEMYIIVRPGLSKERTRFTVAHELGHILLGHVGTYHLVNREPSESDNPIEQEANTFAADLLAPACVLWGCGIKTPEDIAAMCKISLQSAKIRAKRMEVLYERNKFLTSPLERAVYEQFLPFIYSHRR